MGSPSRIYLSECGKTVVLNTYLMHGFTHAHKPIEIMFNLLSKSQGRVIWVAYLGIINLPKNV